MPFLIANLCHDDKKGSNYNVEEKRDVKEAE